MGEEKEDEVTERGYLSLSDDSEDSGMEHAFQGGEEDDTASELSMGELSSEDVAGIELAFQNGNCTSPQSEQSIAEFGEQDDARMGDFV